MDDIVKQALKKWPNVPHCYDWLALDARGDWYMRDERIQHAGPFPQVKGSRIQHEKLREFIERNYLHDDAGCWFFQNGAAAGVCGARSGAVGMAARAGRFVIAVDHEPHGAAGELRERMAR